MRAFPRFPVALGMSLVVSFSLTGSQGAVEAAAPASPLQVGSRSQVFIDRTLVRSADGVTFTLHPAWKHPAGPWMEHRGEGPAGVTVLYDEEEKLFKSWSPTHYNTSKDGLNWTARQQNPPGWKAVEGRHLSVIKDPADPDPNRRFKIIAFGTSGEGTRNNTLNLTDPQAWLSDGYNTYVSPDGRKITHHSFTPILMGKDRISGYFDRDRHRYVAFLQTGNAMPANFEEFKKRREGHPYDPEKVAVKLTLRGFGRDVFSVMTSTDFETWDKPVDMFTPDEMDDAGAIPRLEAVRPLLDFPFSPSRCLMQVGAIDGPYQQESCLVVFPRMVSTTGVERKVTNEVQLAVTRDLLHWERPFRTPVIPRGAVGDQIERSAWDSGWFDDVGPGIDVGDEVWVYYSARNTVYGNPLYGGLPRPVQEKLGSRLRGTVYFSGIGLATWKRDRFVSVDAPPQGGTLTTVPVVFTGNCLELNADAGRDGQIVVELLDPGGKALARSKPVVGNELAYRVEWEEPVDVAGLSPGPLSLRFSIRSASLYAFAFRKDTEHHAASRSFDFKGRPIESKDDFGSGKNAFSINFVAIGNPGNAADTGCVTPTSGFPRRGLGRVTYPYRIAKYQCSYGMVRKANALGDLGIIGVTLPQDGGMRKWDKNRPGDNKPAARCTWLEVAAFINWLNSSTGHHAAYNIDENGILDVWPREEAWQEGGENVLRHKDAFYFLPTNDEYHKAAYYDPMKNVYYKYPKGSDEAPIPVGGGTAPGTMVYAQGWHDGPADIDQAGGLSSYGTMQGGNMHETIETLVGVDHVAWKWRLFRGGCWGDKDAGQSNGRDMGRIAVVSGRNNNDSFRVAARVKP